MISLRFDLFSVSLLQYCFQLSIGETLVARMPYRWISYTRIDDDAFTLKSGPNPLGFAGHDITSEWRDESVDPL